MTAATCSDDLMFSIHRAVKHCLTVKQDTTLRWYLFLNTCCASTVRYSVPLHRYMEVSTSISYVISRAYGFTERLVFNCCNDLVILVDILVEKRILFLADFYAVCITRNLMFLFHYALNTSE